MSIDRRLWSLLWSQRGRVALSLLFSAFAAGGVGAYAFLAGPAVRALVSGASLDPGPLLTRVVPASWLSAFAALGLAGIPALLLMAAAVKAAASAGANALLPGAVAAGAADLRRAIFRRLLRADPAFYQSRSTGDLVSRLTADVTAAEAAALQVVTALVRDTAHVLALVGVCLTLDGRMLLAAAVVVPGVFLPVRRFARSLREVSRQQMERVGELGRLSEQMIQGHRIVQVYGGEAFESRRFRESGERLLAVMRRSLKLRGAYSPTLEILGVIGVCAGLLYAGRAVAAGELAPEKLISFTAAAFLLYTPLKALGNLGEQAARMRAAAERAFALLDAPDAIADGPRAHDLAVPSEVRLESVTVRYGDKVALDGVSLCFRTGETVALVGESGAGKSTVAGLLLRFVDPSAGQVTFDGVDIREGTLRSLRSHVGYVPQETVVFADTAAENIRCGADLSMGEVRRAARAANADAWIERLPGGYGAQLAEKGQNLSGGERQRLGVARALARQARILLLDEATSALDAANDALLQEAFARALSGGRIGIVITHRVASLRNVDRVVVLEAGKVVEEGAPAELLARGGRFARMAELQGMAISARSA